MFEVDVDYHKQIHREIDAEINATVSRLKEISRECHVVPSKMDPG